MRLSPYIIAGISTAVIVVTAPSLFIVPELPRVPVT